MPQEPDEQYAVPCASVGQGLLMNAYRELFGKHEWMTAQLLLTADDFSHRKRYLNMSRTLETLLETYSDHGAHHLSQIEALARAG